MATSYFKVNTRVLLMVFKAWMIWALHYGSGTWLPPSLSLTASATSALLQYGKTFLFRASALAVCFGSNVLRRYLHGLLSHLIQISAQVITSLEMTFVTNLEKRTSPLSLCTASISFIPLTEADINMLILFPPPLKQMFPKDTTFIHLYIYHLEQCLVHSMNSVSICLWINNLVICQNANIKLYCH